MISVIIPHKNSIHLLQRCIKSIPVSLDVETLVIDDNSSISGEEWSVFKSNYPHIKLFLTKEGKGAGYARNVGLKHAKGEWILFADADDFFYPDTFEYLKVYIKENDNDLTYFATNSRDGITGEIIQDRLPRINDAIKQKKIDTLRYYSYVPWGKLIRHQLIIDNNIRFEEVEVSNDIMFSTLVGYYAKSIVIIDKYLYCCTKNNNSLVFNTTPERELIRNKAGIRVNNFLSEKGLIRYRVKTPLRTFFFFPKYPKFFLWSLFNSRYKGALLLYIKDVCYWFIAKIINSFRH